MWYPIHIKTQNPPSLKWALLRCLYANNKMVRSLSAICAMWPSRRYVRPPLNRISALFKPMNTSHVTHYYTDKHTHISDYAFGSLKFTHGESSKRNNMLVDAKVFRSASNCSKPFN